MMMCLLPCHDDVLAMRMAPPPPHDDVSGALLASAGRGSREKRFFRNWALEKQKTELRAKMLNMAKQGEAVAVLRMIRDKRIKVPEAVEAAENATEIGMDGRVVRALEDRTIDVDGKVEELPDTKAEFKDGRHLG